jgi:hypothetical protein
LATFFLVAFLATFLVAFLATFFFLATVLPPKTGFGGSRRCWLCEAIEFDFDFFSPSHVANTHSLAPLSH